MEARLPVIPVVQKKKVLTNLERGDEASLERKQVNDLIEYAASKFSNVSLIAIII